MPTGRFVQRFGPLAPRRGERGRGEGGHSVVAGKAAGGPAGWQPALLGGRFHSASSRSCPFFSEINDFHIVSSPISSTASKA